MISRVADTFGEFSLNWFQRTLAQTGFCKDGEGSPRSCLVQSGASRRLIRVWSKERRRRQWHPTPVLLPGKSHGGAWWAAVHGVVKSQTQLSDFTFTFHFHALEKEMATHSSVLAWRFPGMAEPGGLSSMGSHRVGDDWSDLAAAAAAKKWVFVKNPEYSLEGLMLKLQQSGHLIGRADSLEKTLMLRKTEGRRRRGDRGWDGRMASQTQWTWIWANSGG